MTKTFPEVILGIRTAKKGVEVREDIAQMGEYVEQFASTATTKASEAEKSAERAKNAVDGIDQQKADAVKAVQQAQATATTAVTETKDAALQEVSDATADANSAANAAVQAATDAAGSASTASGAATAATTKAGESAASAEASASSASAAATSEANAKKYSEEAGAKANTDKTLSIENAPADAKATGDALAGKADKSIVQDESGNVIFYSKAEVEAKIKEILAAQREEDHAKIKFWVSDDPTSPAELFGGTWERIEDCTIWGASDTHPDGTMVEAGLPNITGDFDSRGNSASYYGTVGGSRGAFLTKKASGNKNGSYDVNSAKIAADDVTFFDASRSSPIYGASNTVQPPAYCMYIWRRVAWKETL
nr:MAG TPA: baseplate protein [Caudoviricetes sp.]